ncbi:MAG: cell wall hydrolase [Lachnospiraceae bacterium]|jgi:spore germination cell wall hydrolase CwlJ-like protein
MYSKSNILLFIAYTLFTGLLILSKQYEVQAESVDKQEKAAVVTEHVALERFESLERIISYEILKPRYCIEVSEKDLDTLMRIVEAEAGGEDRTGKLLVANVVINRVRNKKFPNNVTDVVYQKVQNVTQFSPVSNGRIDEVTISEETKEVVYSALRGEDISGGALFFMARKYAVPENVAWFDSQLTYLFSYGGHDFYAR